MLEPGQGAVDHRLCHEVSDASGSQRRQKVTSQQMSTDHTRPAPWRIAGGGVVIWLGWVLVADVTWTQVLLVLSPLALVPLGLHIATEQVDTPIDPILYRLQTWTLPPAVLAGFAFFFDHGLVAAIFTIPWLVMTLFIGFTGLRRLLSRPSVTGTGVAADAGLVFLAVGGGWLAISRLGANPLGFGDAIVQLTAVHFHYAGFALPIVTAAVMVCWSPRVDAGVGSWIVLGVPATAGGITLGGWFEFGGAFVMATGGMAVAVGLLTFDARGKRWSRTMLRLAGVALLGGMTLAILWAVSLRFDLNGPDIATMARTHGSLNALGFSVLALVALVVEPARTGPRRPTMLWFRRPGTRTLLALRATTSDDTESYSPIGVSGTDDTPPGYTRNRWSRDVGSGPEVFAAAKQRIASWAGHRAAGIAVEPDRHGVETGQTKALSIPIGRFAVTATARVIYTLDEPKRYGFAYGTLPHHPESGEQSFIVSMAGDGTVTMTIEAVSRPGTVGTKLAGPIARFFQRRAIERYLDRFGDPTSPDP